MARYRNCIVSVVLFAAFQVVYASFVFPQFPLIGDAADYASLISHARFDRQTTHIGFYLAYYPFHLLNQRLLGIEADLFLNVVTTTFGSLCVPLLAAILQRLLAGDPERIRIAGWVGAGLFGLSGLVWVYAEFAEVQALMLLLLFCSILLYLEKAYATSGAVLALSALVSQAVAPCGFWFLALALTRRTPLRQLMIFGGSFGLVLVLGILPIHEDFLWGPRGVLQLYGVYPPVGLLKATALLVYVLLESFWLLVPLLALGLLEAGRQRDLLALSLASAPPFLYVGARLGMADYGFVFQPLMFLAAAWAAVGLTSATRRLSSGSRFVASVAVLVAFGAVTLATYVLPIRRDSEDANACFDRVYELTRRGWLIAQPSVGFAYGHRYWPEESSVWDGHWSSPYDSDLSDALDSDDPVYVLDHLPEPQLLHRTFLSLSPVRSMLTEAEHGNALEAFPRASNELRTVAPGVELDRALSCGSLLLWRLVRTNPAPLPHVSQPE